MQASRRASGNGYDFVPAYEAIAPIVAEADFSFVNQETVLAGAELPLSNYPRFCSPPEVGETMLDLGFNLISTANNLSLIHICTEPITGLYLIWDRPPESWTGTAGSQTLSGGEYGFLHEYLPLESPVTRAELTLPEGSRCCDVYAFGAGELPDWVQQWQPPLADADLLVLPTHADDEHLFFGGTMPYYAGELGKKVQVVYFTNHWAEPYRPHELLDGLWTVGIRNYPVMSSFVDQYADSLDYARTLYDEDEAVAWQVQQLRRFKPEVVVGHDVNGEYGHGVHMYLSLIHICFHCPSCVLCWNSSGVSPTSGNCRPRSVPGQRKPSSGPQLTGRGWN